VYNFGEPSADSNLTKLFHATYQCLEGPPPTKFGTSKMSKIRRDFWHLLTLIANSSRTDRQDENRKSKWSTTTPRTLGKKLVTFGQQTKKS